MIGNYKYVKYQKESYYCSQNINKLKPKPVISIWNEKIAYFFVTNIQKFVSLYDNQQGGYKLEDINSHVIELPINDNCIDFKFMESFIAELEAERIAELTAYLKVSGLDNYKLSKEEEQVLDEFKNGSVSFKDYSFSDIFNNIKQGRRLKKDDQLPGNIPFVMSGTTNTGVVNHISNPVVSFPDNSITIDIFGNAFYRNYSFGAGDDTGVYWNDEKHYSKETMLFFTTVMEKALFGKYSYGKKLRSSKSYDFKMKLPKADDGNPDYKTMELLISAVQKLVIKDVVQYADKKINATKGIVNIGNN